MPARTLAHLSDLRIGESEARDEAARALCDALVRSGIDHVAVTGDLTHSGRYREMLRFEQLFAPLLQAGRMTLVPGPSDRRGDDAGAHLMHSKRVAVARRHGLYFVRLDTTGLEGVAPDAGPVARLLQELDAALGSTPPDVLVALLLHYPLPDTAPDLDADQALGARLLALAKGRCDLVLNGHWPEPHELQLPGPPRPLAAYDAGSSTALLRVRVFTHERGRQTEPPRWLSAEVRPGSAPPPPRRPTPPAQPVDVPGTRPAAREARPSASAAEPFRFALPVSLGGSTAQERAPRLQRYLSEALDQEVEVTLAPSYEVLARELSAGRLGAAWAPPYVCARVESQGVPVLVRGVRKGASTYRAALVCRAEALPRVAKLEFGLTAAWVDRDSVAGYLLPVAYLRARGTGPSRIFASQEFAGSYQAAAEAVLAGRADVTSVFAPAAVPGRPDRTGLDEVVPGREGRFAVVSFTEESPNDGVAVAATTPPPVRDALEKALLGLPDSLTGLGLLKTVFNVERFEKAPPRGYRGLYRVALAGIV